MILYYLMKSKMLNIKGGLYMTDEEKKFFMKINIDKARKKTTPSIILICISIFTYVEPLLYGEFDFGIIFEIASLIFLILSRKNMEKYDLTKSKRYNICALLAVGWLLIYDLVVCLSYISNFVDFIFLGIEFYWIEIFFISYIAILFAIGKDLLKADNPTKFKESTDWFYEKYEKDKNKDIRY